MLSLFVSASGKIVLDKLAQETKASVLSNLTNVVHGLGLIKDDLIKINDSITDLRDRSSQLELGAYVEWNSVLWSAASKLHLMQVSIFGSFHRN